MSSSLNKYKKILESTLVKNPSDFTRVQTKMPTPTDEAQTESSAFFKLIATLSNMHSTVSDYYLVRGNQQKAKYHQDLANRFRADSNTIKNG